MRAAVYARISRDPKGTELGVRRQLADCRALAEREGFEIVGEFVDDDMSAYSGKVRPEYVKLTQLLAAGGSDAVLAWHPDRLTRHPRELEDLIDLLERTHTTCRTVTTGEYDLSTPSGRMAARIVGAVARHESEHKSARLRRKHAEIAERGGVAGGGIRGFGWEPDKLTQRPGEAEIVREIAKRALRGEAVRSLCRDLTRRGVPTSTGGTGWTPTVVRRILMSPRNAGLRTHRGKTTTAVWPAIIDPADHRRLTALLNERADQPQRAPRSYLLTAGLAVCGLCGAALVARPRGDGARCYVCATGPGFYGCGKIRALADPLEEHVAAVVLAALDTPAMSTAIAATEATGDDAITAELDAIEARQTELAEMWSTGEIRRDEWMAARRKLDERRDVIETRTASETRSAATTALLDGIRARWPDLDLQRRRMVLDAVLEAVVVGSAVRGRNVFDPTRVSFRWKA